MTAFIQGIKNTEENHVAGKKHYRIMNKNSTWAEHFILFAFFSKPIPFLNAAGTSQNYVLGERGRKDQGMGGGGGG